MEHAIQQTSLFVYHNEVKPTLGDRQKIIYEVLKSGSNFTNQEVADRLGFQINTVTPRMNELVKLGVVELATKRKCNRTGRTCCAWKIK